MEVSVIVNLVIDFVFKKVKDSGLPISKSQVSIVLGAVLCIVLYFASSFIYTSIEDIIVEEKAEIERTQKVIEHVEDTIETITPPNKNRIKDRVRDQVAKEQDNDASVF
tara:strand:+ start:1500 stop:1826 length:327 start_codon:yes stop_codon:yes gene_type:complete